MSIVKFETYKSAVVSTAHLPEYLAQAMENGDELGFIYDSLEYCYRVLLCPAHEHDTLAQYPDEIRPIILRAIKQGCTWIVFDQDGDAHDDFETWEW